MAVDEEDGAEAAGVGEGVDRWHVVNVPSSVLDSSKLQGKKLISNGFVAGYNC